MRSLNPAMLASFAILALFLLAWEYLPTALDVPKFIIPTLTDCLIEAKRMWAQEGLLQHTLSTALYTVLGFAIGSALGAAIGYLLGMSEFWEKVLSPYILALQIAPKVAFAPLFIMWFGYNSIPKLLVTVLIVFFPVLVNVLQAMRTVDRDLVNLARAYNLSRWGVFMKVEMPSTLPNLMAGLRIASTLAVIGVTVGELVGGNTGLGFLISYGGGQANAAMVFISIVLLTVIGFLLYSVLVRVENRVLHYLPKAEH
ncbi:ABC transporter permease [Marinovum sp. 2_MG-2023]|uniref:ABC transporter permease n=1 Tax=Roseobacteraceae TaxID=2854170 RepID=UPI001FD49DE2|nr:MULTISPECIES: ABC transporter permease [Roseobacteraceae]MCJ7873523.1 ABC transporter permease [Phaeobacter sp. J2-8]MDO6729027.1 ABC transporter permease [Marinovum sp. 2_MG-2023]MDO6779346.1 ABC transporter permease [Marinovum sp. 1_MG-2023]